MRRLQPLRDLQAVRRMALHPERQRLQAAQRQETVERARKWRRPRSAGTSAGRRVPCCRRPRRDAADHVGMAVQIFGRRMDDDVDAELQRPLDIGAAEGVVGDRRSALRRPSAATAFEIDDAQQRIGRRLDPQHAGLRPDRRLDRGKVGEIDEARPADRPSACAPAPSAGRCRHRCRRWRRCGRRYRAVRTPWRSPARPEAKAKPAAAAFEVGDGALEGEARRVLAAGIFEALVHAGLCWRVGRGGVDRHHHRAGRRVMALAAMDGARRRRPGGSCRRVA